MTSRKWISLAILQICFFTFISCQSQEQGHSHGDGTAEHIHPPAEGIAEHEHLNQDQRLGNIKGELSLLKAELAEKGNYNCCVQPACDWCLLYEGSCECYAEIKAGKEVCAGCGLGWHNDKGVVKGVKKAEVKWNITHEHGEGGGHKH